MKTQLTQEIELKARKKAETIAKSSSVEIVDPTNDDMFLSDKILSDYEVILRACRKSVLDGFPLDKYCLREIPCIEEGCAIAYFNKIDEYGMGENYNPNAHEIIFVCDENKDVAVPYTTCNDGKGVYIEECADCFKAVYLIGE